MTEPFIPIEVLREAHAWYMAEPGRRIADIPVKFGRGSDRAWRNGFERLGLARKRAGGNRRSSRSLSKREERIIARRILEDGERIWRVMVDTRLGEHRIMGILARHGFDVSKVDRDFPGEAQLRDWHRWYMAEERRTLDDLIEHSGVSRAKIRRWFGCLGLAFKPPGHRGARVLESEPDPEVRAARQRATAEAERARAATLETIEDWDFDRARLRRAAFGVFRRVDQRAGA